MGILGGVFVLESGLRILIRAPQVPFSVPPKTPSQWASYCAESEKISLYVEIHRKNPVDVMIQELVSKVQFPRPFLRIKRFLADFWVRQWKMFFSKQPKKLNFWNHILNPHIKPVLSVYLNISGYFFTQSAFLRIVCFFSPNSEQHWRAKPYWILTKLYYCHSVNNVSHVNIVNHANIVNHVTSANHVNSVNNVNNENHANSENHVNSESSVWRGANSISDVFFNRRLKYCFDMNWLCLGLEFNH